MNDRTDTLRAVACLIEDLRFLRGTTQTRLHGYSTQFVLDVRRELQAFNEDLDKLINRQMAEKTGDTRPFIQDVRRMK